MPVSSKFLLFFISALFFLTPLNASPDTTASITWNSKNTSGVTYNIESLEDVHHAYTITQVTGLPFVHSSNSNLNFGNTTAAYWIKVHIKNDTQDTLLVLKLSNPTLDTIDFYEQYSNQYFTLFKTGEARTFRHRPYLSSDYLFPISVTAHSEKIVFFRISSTEAIIVPVSIGTEVKMLHADKYKDIFWGVYIGLMLAMLLYNVFIFATVRDRSYLYYIFYVLTVLVTQITLSGYGFQLLWPTNMWIAKYSSMIAPGLVGIAGIEFTRHFLKTKFLLSGSTITFIVLNTLYVGGMLLCLLGNYGIGFHVIDATASLAALYILIAASRIAIKGYRPAKFFLVAWGVFLVGIFVFVFKNFNVLPYNNFTVYTMPVGSAMEVLLLSFALADRINIFKREKEISQAELLSASQENARIIKEQNVILETKVAERTFELNNTNNELSITLTELKNAQANLVESEKMASLGQLTAGVAHEINNPINFVIANVKPLKRDFNMLIETIAHMEGLITADNNGQSDIIEKITKFKEEIEYDYLLTEIDYLLKGISEGSERTAEIVKGLRVFARVDEYDLKRIDIHEGIDSTIIIINSLLENTIVIDKEYAELPMIECFPGKLNQVFLNIISNSIHAIRDRFKQSVGGMIRIRTSMHENTATISISDNGCGMDEQVIKKVFEPFFTTKDVGLGTGLGLSIANNIIIKHNGTIKVHSVKNEGTEFVIEIPISH